MFLLPVLYIHFWDNNIALESLLVYTSLVFITGAPQTGGHSKKRKKCSNANCTRWFCSVDIHKIKMTDQVNSGYVCSDRALTSPTSQIFNENLLAPEFRGELAAKIALMCSKSLFLASTATLNVDRPPKGKFNRTGTDIIPEKYSEVQK